MKGPRELEKYTVLKIPGQSGIELILNLKKHNGHTNLQEFNY